MSGRRSLLCPTRPAGASGSLISFGVVAVLIWFGNAGAARGQTYTDPNGRTFTNIVAWNFGAGPIPSSNSAGTLTIQNFGTGSYAAANDLNLTLNTIQFNNFGPSGNTNLGNTLNGTYTFAGAGQIQINGSGGSTGAGNFGAQISAGFVIGSSATGVTVNAAGAANGIAALNTNLSSVIASNTFAGAPLVINTNSLPNTGVLMLSSANTFAGGVQLTSGNLLLNANAGVIGIFGNNVNTLTINSGSRGTVSGTAAFINPVVLADSTANFVITGGRGNEATTLSVGGLLGNGVSGAGGVVVRPAGTASVENFQGINTYTGATTIGQIQYATNGTPGAPGVMRLQGAVGQLTATSAINVADGAVLEINKSGGDSVNNARVPGGAPINVTSSIVQIIGSAGLTTQGLGTLTATGSTTVALGAASASTSATIANLVRSNNGTLVFSGANLGNAAAAAGVSNANVLLTQINGAAPTGALVGGGGAAGSTNVSIIPWAIGDSQNAVATTSGTTSTTFGFGSGFVTYDTNGVRLLTSGEYNTGNFATTPAATDNMRVSASAALAAPTTVNSVFFGTASATISGSALNITSGALASNVTPATISAPVTFGGGTGEAIVSVIGTTLGSSNTMTLSGALTASTLTKTGSGILVLSGTGSSLSSDKITVNAGVLQIGSLANLGLTNTAASTLVFDMQTSSSLNGGLLYTGAGTETYNGAVQVNAGHAQLRLTGGGNLTFAGSISGAGAINIDPGTTAGSVVTLSGNNASLTGGVRLGSGTASTFQFSNDNNLGAPTAPLTINTTGMTVKLLGNWTTTRNIALEGALGQGALAGAEGFDTAGFNSTWGGQVLGGGAIFKIDSGVTPGTWTVTSANNPYTGTITLGTNFHQGGTLALSGAGDLNAASVTFGNGAISVAGTYALDFSAATGPGTIPWRSIVNLNTTSGFTQAHAVQLGTSAGSPVDVRVGAGTFGNGGSGVIQGFGELVKTGTGTLTLSSSLANTFAAGTGEAFGVEIWGGTLTVSNDNQLGAGTNNVLLRGGALSTVTNAVTTSRNFALIPTPIILLNPLTNGFSPATALTINGTLSDAAAGGGGFEKTGVGTLTLAGTNTFTGNVRLTAGTLAFSSDANLGGTAANMILNGGTLQLTAGAVTTGRTAFLTAASTLDVNGTNLQFNGPLWGSSNVTKISSTAGTGGLTLNAADPYYFGTLTVGNGTNSAGNLTLTSTGTLPRANVTLAAASNATLDMSGLTKDLGNFNSSSATTLALGSGGQVTFGWNNANTTISGITTGATGTIFQVGTGGVTINNVIMSAGGYNVMFAGNLTLNSTAGGGSNGALLAQSAVTVGAWGNGLVRGPTLTLDNTNANFDRIADGQTVFFNSSELALVGNTTTASAETIGTLAGGGYTFVTAGTTAAGGSLNFATGLTRVNNGTFLFRSGATGTLGNAAAALNQANLFFGNLPGTQLVGGGGAAGNAQVSILPYAVGDDYATGVGSTFVTYGTNGIRTLQNASGEYNATLIGAGSTDNVRVVSASPLTTLTLTADQTVNSLILTTTPTAGSPLGSTLITGNQRLIVGSGAILAPFSSVYAPNATGTGGSPLGIQNTELQTGNGNAQQLNVFTTGGDLAIGAKVTTSGGLVKSGVGSLYLTNATNSYTGGTTVNGGSLVIDSLSAINDAGGNTLTLGGGYFKYRGPSATLASGVVLGGGSVSNPGMGGGFNVVSGTTLTLPLGGVSGNGGIVKDGTGVLALQGANTFKGPVIIDTGAVSIDGPAALGTSSRLLFGPDSGNGYGVASGNSLPGASLRFLNPMTLTQEIDIVSSNAALGAGFDVPTAGQSVTLSGVIAAPSNNSKGLYKLGAGNLTLTAANTYTGSTQVFGGNLILAGPTGSALASTGAGGFNAAATFVANFGSGIILDNTNAAGGNNNNRLPDVFSDPIGAGDSATGGGIRLVGGNFTVRGNEAVATGETTNRFEVFAGTVTLQSSGQNVTLTTGRVNRTDNDAVALIRGDNLGAATGTRANWFAVDLGSGSTQLGGAGGAKGTPFINIVPGFMGDTSATGTGTDLVTYDSAVGFRLLTAGEYTTAFAGTIGSPNYDNSRAPIIGLSASAAAPAFTSWTTALKLSGSAALSGTATVNVTQSTVLATGDGTPSITVPALQSIGNGGYDFLVAGATNLTVGSGLNGSKLYKYGTGTLTLANAYYGAGQVFVGQGTLALSGANASLNPIGSNVIVAAGGTLTLGGADRTIASINTQSLVGSFNLNQVADGTIALGANKLTLYDSVTSVFTGQITGTSASTLQLGLFNAGTTTLTQPQPGFAGTVRVNNGTFQLASGGTLPNASLIDVRGGTFTLNNIDDNGAAGGHIANRIPTSTAINLAGNLTFIGNGNVVANQSLGTVNLVGGGTITLPDVVSISALNRTNRGTLVVANPATSVSGFGGTGTGWTANVLAGSGAGTGTFPSNNVLELTAAVNSSASSAWFNTAVSTRAFTASFTYTVPAGSAGNPADGITFGFQNQGLTALGSGGGNLGYQGVTPSAVMQLNIFSSNTDIGSTSGGGGSGLGVVVNGAGPPHVQTSAPVQAGTFNSPTNVVINYDGTTMTVTLSQGTSTYSSSFPLNVANAVGASAFVGFTGATGGLNAQQNISNFTFTSAASSLGSALSPAGGAQLLTTQINGGSPTSPTTLIGGGTAAGTTTVSILPWAWSTTGSFVTYDPTNGIRPLNTTAEYLTAFPVAATSDNVRTTAATALTQNTEVNSLISTSGGISGAFDLTLRSGALAVTGAGTIGVNTNALKTGSGGANTAELIVFNPVAVTLNYNVGTSGGVTKFGGGALTLGGTNTFSGGLTINGGSVAFSADTQLGSTGNTVTFGIPTNAASPNGLGLQFTGTVLATPAITRNFVTNSFGGIIGPQNQVTTLNNTISGPGAFAFNNTVNNSIYEVNGANSYSGDTYINFGQVSITGDTAFGNSPVIQLNSGTSTDGFDLRANWTTSRTLHMRSAGGIDTNGFTATLNGPIIGPATLTKNNNGALVLTAPSPYTGALSINAGDVRLVNQGSLGSTGSQGVGFGARLILDDTGTHYSDRLPDNGSVSMNHAEFQLLGNPSVTTEEVIGSLTLGLASKVTVVAGTGQAAILRLGNGATLTRSTGSSVLFRGSNLGVNAPGTANSANIMIFNPIGSAGALTGGGGPAGNTAISVIAGAFGDTSATGFGTQLVTYDLAKGIRLLATSEYATALNNGTVTNDNVHLTGATPSIANATSINALWLDSGAGVSGAGTLTIAAGNVLVTGTGNTLSVPVVGGTVANAIAIGGSGDLTVNAAIPSTNTGGLIKTGSGTLTLPVANAYTGATTLSSGTIAVGNNASLSTGVLQIMSDDGTLAATTGGLILANQVSLSGSLHLGGANSLTLNGAVPLQSASRAINVDSGLTLTLGGVISASNTGIAGNGLVKLGTGLLAVTGANTYGSSGTPGFYLTQTVVNAGELRVNNTSGSGTGGSTVVVNSGGTLSGTGFIVPAQALESRNTVVINNGAVLSPGLPTTSAAPGTLTVGSSTTAGVTTASVSLLAGSKLAFFENATIAPTSAGIDTGGSTLAGTNNLLAVNGTLSIDPGTIVQIAGNFSGYSSTSPYSYQVATATPLASAVNIVNQSQFNTTNFVGYTPGTFAFALHNVGNTVVLNFQPVPEPSLVLTVCAGVAALTAVRRRRAIRPF